MLDLQTIIAGIIMLIAAIYIGRQVWRKIYSLTAKDSAGCDTGCGSCASSKTPKEFRSKSI